MTPEELNDHCIARLKESDFPTRVAIVGSGPSSPYIAPIGKLEELLTNSCGVAKNAEEYFWNFAERAYQANPVQYFNIIRGTYEETFT